jgi:hypothetical protein
MAFNMVHCSLGGHLTGSCPCWFQEIQPGVQAQWPGLAIKARSFNSQF